MFYLKSKYLWLATLMATGMLLLGCQSESKVEVTNVGEHFIVVGTSQIHVAIHPGESIKFARSELATLIIQIEMSHYTYDLSALPHEGTERRDWGIWAKQIFPVAIDSKAQIWATGQTDDKRYAVNGQQPLGFPVKPVIR